MDECKRHITEVHKRKGAKNSDASQQNKPGNENSPPNSQEAPFKSYAAQGQDGAMDLSGKNGASKGADVDGNGMKLPTQMFARIVGGKLESHGSLGNKGQSAKRPFEDNGDDFVSPEQIYEAAIKGAFNPAMFNLKAQRDLYTPPSPALQPPQMVASAPVFPGQYGEELVPTRLPVPEYVPLDSLNGMSSQSSAARANNITPPPSKKSKRKSAPPQRIIKNQDNTNSYEEPSMNSSPSPSRSLNSSTLSLAEMISNQSPASRSFNSSLLSMSDMANNNTSKTHNNNTGNGLKLLPSCKLNMSKAHL